MLPMDAVSTRRAVCLLVCHPNGVQVMNVVTHYPIAGIFLAGLVGLIPNCAASITITKFYLEGVLNVGSMFAGLLSCAGIGLIVLFKTNHSWKKNVMIVATLYGISVVCGIIVEILFGM